MPIPALSAFSFDPAEQLWRSKFRQLECDLAIEGQISGPSVDDYALLSRALSEFDSILERSHHYISAFCPASDFGERAPHKLVEICVRALRGTKVVSIYLHYENDAYGLWSVDITWDQYNTWSPVAFRREIW